MLQSGACWSPTRAGIGLARESGDAMMSAAAVAQSPRQPSLSKRSTCRSLTKRPCSFGSSQSASATQTSQAGMDSSPAVPGGVRTRGSRHRRRDGRSRQEGGAGSSRRPGAGFRRNVRAVCVRRATVLRGFLELKFQASANDRTALLADGRQASSILDNHRSRISRS